MKLKIIIYLLCSLSLVSGFSQNCIHMEEIPPPPNGSPSCLSCFPGEWSGYPGVELISPGYLQLQAIPNWGECVTFTASGLTTGVPYSFSFWWIVLTDQNNPLIGCCAEITVTVQNESFHFATTDNWSLVNICITPETSELEFEICASLPPPYLQSAHVWIDNAICTEEAICCPLRIEMVDELFVCPETDFEINPDIIDYDGPVSFLWTSEPPDGIIYLNDTAIEDPIFNYNPAEIGFPGTTYIFTLLATDDNCQAVKEVKVIVLPLKEVTFNLQDFYCTSDGIFTFPTVSLEGYNGTWLVPSINLADYPDQAFENFFIANDGEVDCPVLQSFEIFIKEFHTPTFDFSTILCRTEMDVFTFPLISLEGVEGTWSIPSINLLFDSNEQITSTFTPSGLFCSEEISITMDLLEGEPVSFDLPSKICGADSIYTWPSYSNEGILGTWSVPSIDLSNFSGNTLINIFKPEESLAGCYLTYEDSLTISDLPIFEESNEFCINDPIVVLDSFDSQGYQGSWTISAFNLDTISSDSFVSTWTALPGQSLCITDSTFVFHVISPTPPLFNFESTFCEADTIFFLDTIDLNGISGTWSIPFIDPSQYAGEEVVSIFTPSENESCVLPDSTTFTITQSIIPNFLLSSYFCFSDPDFTLPLISDNGVEGCWSIKEIDISENAGSLIETIFTTTDQSCSETYTHEIFILEPFEINAIVSNPTGCQIDDGTINIVGNIQDMEFSIDGGNSWQNNSFFDLLPSGTYEILARYLNYPTCFESLETMLTSPDSPELIEIQIEQLSSCDLPNATISVIALGDSLQYSIDGGINYQSSPDFTNLDAGIYDIVVIEFNNPNCFVQAFPEIVELSQSTISEVYLTDVSNCNMQDGIIVIDAEGINLEFSIDGGLSWSDSPIFTNLTEGQFEIVVRSKDALDCDDYSSVEIFAPDQVEITDYFVVQPKTCNPTLGSINVIAEGIDLLYSIDNGLTWSSSSTFSNLEAGSYLILVSEVSFSACLDSLEVELSTELDGLEEAMLEISIPSDCETEDGSIIIGTNDSDIEFSIDNGVTWQSSNKFLNLGAGNYTLIIRKILLPDCFIELDFEIEMPECPCADLYFTVETEDIICLDANVGEILITDVSGMDNPAFLVQWEDGTLGLQNINLSEGWHGFTIFYDQDCEWRDSAFLERFDPLTFVLESFDTDCKEAENGSINISNVEGGSGQYLYSIEGNTFQSSGAFYNLSADQYEAFVLDDLGCLSSDYFEIFDNMNSSIILPDIVTIEAGETIFLNPLINQETIDSFTWSPDTGILNLGDLIAELRPTHTATYSLTIYYGNCIETKTITIIVEEKHDISISNAFSPNNDGVNDYFFIQGSESSDIQLRSVQIFDRWGNLVFTKRNPELNNPMDGWDGTFKNQRVQQGVFTYCVKYSLAGKEEIKAGSITILR